MLRKKEADYLPCCSTRLLRKKLRVFVIEKTRRELIYGAGPASFWQEGVFKREGSRGLVLHRPYVFRLGDLEKEKRQRSR